MVTHAPQVSAAFLPTFIAPVRELMNDAREEVREAALAAMQLALSLVGNRDLEPLLQVWSRHCFRIIKGSGLGPRNDTLQCLYLRFLCFLG
jgi:hypothetical protein